MKINEFFDVIQHEDNIKNLTVNTTNILNAMQYKDNEVAMLVKNFFINTLPYTAKLAKVGKNPIFRFRVEDKNIFYDYSSIEEALAKNFNCPNKELKVVANYIKDFIECYLEANPTKDFESYFREDNKKPTKNYPVLERYAQLIINANCTKERNEEDIVSFIFQYPFINSNEQLKKHLIMGFKSNTGKSIITNGLRNLYIESSIMMPIRISGGFDEGNWNMDVIDKFLTIIDDDGADTKGKTIDVDFMKNFMNTSMPIRLARSGVRENAVYHGSSVIATNTFFDAFQDDASNKRTIFVTLSEDITGMFTEDELDYLHNLPKCDMLHYVEQHPITKDPTYWYRERKNDFPKNDDIEHQKEELIRYLSMLGAAKLSELTYAGFDKQLIKQTLGKARSFYFKGTTIYGYKLENGKHDFNPIIQKYTDVLNFSYYNKITTTHDIQKLSVSVGAFKTALLNAYKEQLPKAENHVYGMYKLKDDTQSATLKNLAHTTAIVLDIDESKYKSLSDVKEILDTSGYKGLIHETPSSTPEKLRYRVIVPGIELSDPNEYKKACMALSVFIGEQLDVAANTAVHRFFMSGFNVQTFGITVQNKDGLVAYIENLPKGKGQRHNALFYAINRAKDDDDKELALALCNASTLPKDEIQSIYNQIWNS